VHALPKTLVGHVCECLEEELGLLFKNLNIQIFRTQSCGILMIPLVGVNDGQVEVRSLTDARLRRELASPGKVTA
jgi:hypothetical protein